MSMTRRTLMLSGAAALGGCVSQTSGAQIDQQVAASKSLLFSTVPGTQELSTRSAGMLVIPNIIEGGFVLTGAYGEGALMVGEATVDYISVTAAAVGFQAGAQSYSQALFFSTPDTLARFRQSDGFELGVDAEVALISEGASIGTSSTTLTKPVYQVIYGQKGLIAGASLEGAKYSRLIR
ncbi:MAG: lipid-binding SYLF domain-containing protein [Pseudomonadota bacterium]